MNLFDILILVAYHTTYYMNTLLTTIGLTPNEASIYLSLLKQKEKTAAEIARTLHMDKSSCYRAVESLIEKGLIIANPKKRGTTHSAVSPDVLKDIHEQKIRELRNKRSELDQFISHLLKQEESRRSTFIKVETGIEAIRSGMDANLTAAINTDKVIKEFYRLSFPYFKDPEHVAWVNNFAKRRIAAGISMKVIVDFAGEKIFQSLMKTDVKILKEIRLMPEEMKGLYALRISGDITTIISFDEKKNYIHITIKDRFVAQLMDSLFDFTWINCKKYI